MKRQQQYVGALYDKFEESVEADDELIVDITLAIADYMVSDRSVTQLQTLAEKFNDYEFLGIQAVEGESVRGDRYMEFSPDLFSWYKTLYNFTTRYLKILLANIIYW